MNVFKTDIKQKILNKHLTKLAIIDSINNVFRHEDIVELINFL